MHVTAPIMIASLPEQFLASYIRTDREGYYLTDGHQTGVMIWDRKTSMGASEAWDLVHGTRRIREAWPDQIGAAAGVLHAWGTGPAVTAATLRAWPQPSTTRVRS